MRGFALGVAGTLALSSIVPMATRAHGLIEDPPARNWFCGLDTPPDRAARGDTDNPTCREVFVGTGAGGYQFMSVLTHDKGRSSVRPLPENVCGFDSESFGNGATPWDRAADWPTSELSPGRNKFTWNISWGPHFSDTEEFRYWITKRDFTFRADRALAWSDFESEPFCALGYDDSAPRANPDVVARPDEARFDTYCEVPARDGHHVIYAEWGRNYFTFERFHGCVDVSMGNSGPNPTPPLVEEPPAEAPRARIERNPAVEQFIGEGAMRLYAVGAEPDVELDWSVSAPDSSNASLQDVASMNAVLSLGNPAAAGRITVTLRIANAVGSDTASFEFEHVPAGGTTWADLGRLVEARVRPALGERVQLRLVDGNGVDTYLPPEPLVLDATTRGARDWPAALADVVAASDTDVRIGRLDQRGRITARRDATANGVFARLPTGYVSAFVEFGRDVPEEAGTPSDPNTDPDGPAVPPSADCAVTTRPSSNAWWAGFDVATDAPEVRLDFSGSGVDLAALNVDSGVFDASIDGQTLTLRTPSWVSGSTPGYFGVRANDLPALADIRLGCD